MCSACWWLHAHASHARPELAQDCCSMQKSMRCQIGACVRWSGCWGSPRGPPVRTCASTCRRPRSSPTPSTPGELVRLPSAYSMPSNARRATLGDSPNHAHEPHLSQSSLLELFCSGDNQPQGDRSDGAVACSASGLRDCGRKARLQPLLTRSAGRVPVQVHY